MKLRRRSREGEELPRGYGVAWHDPRYRAVVCYPVPLNKVAGWAHTLYWKLVEPPKGPEVEALRERLAQAERQVQFYRDKDRRDQEFQDRILRAAREQLPPRPPRPGA